jgi:hypothetical membrane protein
MIAFVVTAAVVTPNYSLVRDTVSDLGGQGSPHPWIIGTGLITVGILAILFGWGLSRVVTRGGAAVRVAFIIYGSATALTGVARNYGKSPNAVRNLEGLLHNTSANISVFGLVLSMAVIAWETSQTPVWRRATWWTVVTITATSLGAAVFWLVPAGDHGLVERVTFAADASWFIAIAAVALSADKASCSHQKT